MFGLINSNKLQLEEKVSLLNLSKLNLEEVLIIKRLIDKELSIRTNDIDLFSNNNYKKITLLKSINDNILKYLFIVKDDGIIIGTDDKYKDFCIGKVDEYLNIAFINYHLYGYSIERYNLFQGKVNSNEVGDIITITGWYDTEVTRVKDPISKIVNISGSDVLYKSLEENEYIHYDDELENIINNLYYECCKRNDNFYDAINLILNVLDSKVKIKQKKLKENN